MGRTRKHEGRAPAERSGRLLQGNAVRADDDLQERFDALAGPVEVTRRCIPERDVHVEPHVGCILR